MCFCSANCHESVAVQAVIQHGTREPGHMLNTYFNRPSVLRTIDYDCLRCETFEACAT